MKFEEFLVTAHAILDAYSEIDPEQMLPLLCTLIDLTAAKNDKSGLELITELTPVIAEVGEELGRMEIIETSQKVM